MPLKITIFILISFIPLFFWNRMALKKGIQVDYRLALSYFIFGSWFGMYGELFLYKIIDWIFHEPIWEYRTLPIHHGITSSYGPAMWGIASIYICYHKNYKIFNIKYSNKLMAFINEAGFLLVLEVVFNVIAYGIFNDYFFYYFVPDLGHWTSITNMPFWWVGYKMMVKYAGLLNRNEKLNLAIAIVMIIVAIFPD